MATRIFEGIKFFKEILNRAMTGLFLRSFIKSAWVISERKKFEKKLKYGTDGRTDARTHDDTGP